jgi:hypothetical protein
MKCLVYFSAVSASPLGDLGQGFEGQVGVHGFGTVAGQHGEVVGFTGGAGFHDQAGAGAQALGHQVLVNRRGGEQGRDGHVQRIDLAVGDDQDVGAIEHRVLGFRAQGGQAGFDAFLAPGQRVADVQFGRTELVLGVTGDLPQLRHVGEGQHRLGTSRRYGGLISLMPSRLGRGPTKDTSDMTSCSRIGSIGGLVTWAKSWRK